MKDRDLGANDDRSDPALEDTPSGGLSRRRFLERGGIVVVGTAGLGTLAACGSGSTKTTTVTTSAAAQTSAAPTPTGSAPAVAASPASGLDAHALTALNSAQARTLDAALSRLIPKDENGPGASEAMVWRYIDRSLGGELSTLLPIYADGLAELDQAASAAGKPTFADLDATKQDAILKALSTSKEGDGAAFFATLHEHALEGMFGDPFHGGNVGFAGWDLLGFPGIKGSWSADEQAVGTVVKPVHKSTYEIASFGLQSTGA